MEAEDLAASIRTLSEALFSQRYRLELMVAIAESDGLVCLTDLAASLGVTASNLQKPLQSLTDAGLLTRMPAMDAKRRFYRRNASLAWDFAQEMRSWAVERAQTRTP